MGVDFMHRQGWIHRDLKPGNLLINKIISSNLLLPEHNQSNNNTDNNDNWKDCIHQAQLKIADFGLSRTQENPSLPMTKEIMTLWYRAPEVILDNLTYTKEIDLWSAGVIIFEMLTGSHMFEATSEIDMLMKIFRLKGTPQKAEASSSNSNDVNTTQTIKHFKKYPHLMKYGLMFPKL